MPQVLEGVLTLGVNKGIDGIDVLLRMCLSPCLYGHAPDLDESY